MDIRLADTNALRSPAIIDHLESARGAHIALTQLTLRETFKRNALSTATASFERLRKHANRVLVLKDPTAARRVSSNYGARMMISRSETKGFRTFLHDLFDPDVREHVAAYCNRWQSEATDYFSELTERSEHLDRLFRAIWSKRFTPDERVELRLRRAFSTSTQRKLLDMLAEASAPLFADEASSGLKMPNNLHEALDTYGFRYSLCMVLLYGRWAMDVGGERKPARILNDVVDMQIAAHATYFNGIITSDEKMLSIFYEARWLLRSWPAFLGQMKKRID